MRCGCFECGAYMIQAESVGLGCVCPECGYRCRACMGTNTMMDRSAVKSLKAIKDADEAGSAAPADAQREAKQAILERQLRMLESERTLNAESRAPKGGANGGKP